MPQDAATPGPAPAARGPRPAPPGPATGGPAGPLAVVPAGATGGAVRPGPPPTPTGAPASGAAPADGATGDPRVDDALLRLEGLDGLPVHEHVRVFESVQAALQGRLADVED